MPPGRDRVVRLAEKALVDAGIAVLAPEHRHEKDEPGLGKRFGIFPVISPEGPSSVQEDHGGPLPTVAAARFRT